MLKHINKYEKQSALNQKDFKVHKARRRIIKLRKYNYENTV